MSKCIKHKKRTINPVQYIPREIWHTYDNAQCNINSFINRVCTVKLQYQPIQVKAWEAYKQVGGTLYINDLLAAKYGNKKHSGNIKNLSENHSFAQFSQHTKKKHSLRP